MNDEIVIRSFPRIHVTLIGMSDTGYRINGGIGFSISDPTTDCHFISSTDVVLKDEREGKFTANEQRKLCGILRNIIDHKKFKKAISCIITGEVLPHLGLGSTTSIYLSCIEALFLINNIQYKNEELIALSKRGGTSGIGINTYFDGGFVFDVGIRNENDLLKPSSIAERKGKKPLVVYKGKSPNWDIGICIPEFLNNMSEQEEIDFFKRNCPIDKLSVSDILYESVFGITSSVIERDYGIFCESLQKIQLTRWKYLERSQYGSSLIELEQKITHLGADCVGMSSMGPLLFFLGKNINDIIIALKNKTADVKCYFSTFNNQGRIITYA